MDTNYKISIPKPCNEDWDKMVIAQNGKFCSSCAKNVVDFTTMSPEAIQQYFNQNKEKNICGRFQNKQLETLTIQIPSHILYSQVSFHKMFLLALFVAMGTSLFSCKDHNGNTKRIDNITVTDSVEERITLGMSISPTNHIEEKEKLVEKVKSKKKHFKNKEESIVTTFVTAGDVVFVEDSITIINPREFETIEDSKTKEILSETSTILDTLKTN